MDDLRALPANAVVLRHVESRESHGDLAEVLVRHVRRVGGLRIVAVGAGGYPALVAAREDSRDIVAVAVGMHELALRAGPTAPDDARLEHRADPALGSGWWWVCPFSPDVSRPDTDAELVRWFAGLPSA